MKNIIIFLSVALFITNCTAHDSAKQESSAPKPADSPVTDYAGCYEMTIEKDIATMMLTDSAGKFYGTLEYRRFEKDGNKGNIYLVKEKDMLTGWYNFYSEGLRTVRQISFKMLNGKLAEGYGDVGMYGDSVYFKYPAALRFEENHPFSKVNCNR